MLWGALTGGRLPTPAPLRRQRAAMVNTGGVCLPPPVVLVPGPELGSLLVPSGVLATATVSISVGDPGMSPPLPASPVLVGMPSRRLHGWPVRREHAYSAADRTKVHNRNSCSQWGWCGAAEQWCGVGCQKAMEIAGADLSTRHLLVEPPFTWLFLPVCIWLLGFLGYDCRLSLPPVFELDTPCKRYRFRAVFNAAYSNYRVYFHFYFILF